MVPNRQISAIAVTGYLLTQIGCATVPINTGDGSAPIMTIKVDEGSGYQVKSSVTHSNSTAQQKLKIMCIAEDPQGIKSMRVEVIDDTVSAAYCAGGGVYSPGNFQVAGMPSPVGDTLSGSSGKVPTKLAGIIEIPGMLTLATKPPNVTVTCYPGNNTFIKVRCRGRNWSSNAAVATASKNLQIDFKF